MTLKKEILHTLSHELYKKPETATAADWHTAVGRAVMTQVMPAWRKPRRGKRVGYFSAEFLIGRLVESNLLNIGERETVAELLRDRGVDPAIWEGVEDAALGNGGLGRLAACFLDSGATLGLPLDGYGIRYQYGLFKQSFEDGFQRETADNWQKHGDPWSVRREEQRVTVTFGDQRVYAVPYDTPVIGYGGQTVNTLRLWQAEALQPFDFDLFNRQQYDESVQQQNDASRISAVLYPNDDTEAGKRLRLKQQYFFTSASLQDMLRTLKARGNGRGGAWNPARFADAYAIQLNDTHPVVAIPELIRLLVEQEGVSFTRALGIARATFAYTNHTILPEALEKWSVPLFRDVLPHVYEYVVRIHHALQRDLRRRAIIGEEAARYWIIENNTIHMARLAIFATHSVNGVARLHTEILRDTALPHWWALYPDRLNNKTNGITQRRWLALANPELSALITEHIGSDWVTDLPQLKRLTPLADDNAFLDRFAEIKAEKKRQLAAFIRQKEGVSLNPSFIFDIQAKRLHEYKRQLLNAFSILDTYFALKDGTLTDFTPTAYIFGAKAAPGYARAKAIIKYINEIARMIATDPDTADKLQVVFVSNYNVSYAEKIMPAADISEQISTAGTEASGTGNMKFMLNGAVTLGTYDGANVEIVEQAGEENNYIFGLRVADVERLKKEGYDPRELYDREPRIRRVVDTLIDGTVDDGGTGLFRELYTALLDGALWHAPDHYFLLADLLDYCETKRRANRDYADRRGFTRRCVLNTANAGVFSSDRTVADYARDIWGV